MPKETFTLILEHVTLKAHGFREVEKGPVFWIPNQFIGEMSYPKKNNIVEVEIDEWIAKEKGLI